MNAKMIEQKLSNSQLLMYRQLRENIHLVDVASRGERKQAKPTAQPSVRQTADSLFKVDGPVEILRDVKDTAYRAGQRGVVLALHNMPANSRKSVGPLAAGKVVAEVLINETLYASTLSLADLKVLG